MINHDNFNTHSRDAVTLIDLACNFLSNNLGFGLSKTDKLIPHPTTVVTLAIVWKFLKDSEKENESDVKRHLEKWIIHSTLSKRYTEGSQTKMEKDARELVKYFKELFRGNNPDYPECFKFEGLTSDILYTIPSSAQGRLVRSFFNLQKPRDPLKFDNRVYYDESYSEPQEHHIWPKKFLKGIPGWTEDKEANNVLNIMFVTAETNKEFDSLNPADQLQLIEQKVPEEARRQEIFKANFLSPRCIELMKKPNKNREDYIDFLNARHEIIVDYLNNYFGIENSNN
tara:strand:- start:51 stop:902 length:852 start_codon:yes stop_codon:yes gene_type:complete